ncbi:histone acetyltransferase MCC1 isoform X2 [Spinacia oleracea]|uniref:N-alpha-acetyltransferase 60 n=1 Tax=Spinacia oleracea TaxID=3562 RepID=A0ABM3RG28_SPIOL|nr:histone acetyltransferase MCC1 isoform X2 [Spinacia oleracea]
MLGRKTSHRPLVAYRPIGPSDLGILQQLHADLFPIRYEPEFFHNVVNRRDIISWGAVDRSRPNSQRDDLIGFVTIKMVPARESEITDLVRCDPTRSDQTLVYILTLGVVEAYRKFGIASALIREVIRYAKTIPTCRAAYLHVISYNTPAIYLYKRMSFACVRRLYGFYIIEGQHYDAYLFVYYVNGGRSPCSPLEPQREVIRRGFHPRSWVQPPKTKLIGVRGFFHVAQMGFPSATLLLGWFTSSRIKYVNFPEK